VIETCPALGCDGPRVPDSPDRLADFLHAPRCPVATAEAETLAGDLARHRRRPLRAVRHRLTTPAERARLASSGVIPDPSDRRPIFCRVEWITEADDLVVRRQTWRGVPMVAEDTVGLVSA